MHRHAISSLLLAALVLSWAGCSSASRVSSLEPDLPIVLDASTDEWGGRMMRVQDGLASIGVQDDRETVFVAFVTRDRSAIQKIVASGFTVWLDAEGGQERRLGIRFPLGTGAPQGRGPVSEGQGGFRNAHGEQGGPLEVIGEDGRPGRYGPDQADGIRVRADIEPESFMYELAVDRRLLGPTGVLGVGFETEEIERPGGDGPGRGAMPGETRQGRGRSADPGIRGGRGPAGDIGPLKIWARVRLANR
jgi:hypothetical protein